MDKNRRRDLLDIALLCARLGFTAFGGPAAHIALLREEVVRRRAWMSEQHFLDLIGATNLIPGPNSTEMVMHVGRERGGALGLVIAGACFILPAVFITFVFAFLYKNYGQLPEVQPFIKGIKPVIVAIVLMAIVPMAKRSMQQAWLWVLSAGVLAGALLGLGELWLLLAAGVLGVGFKQLKKEPKALSIGFLPLLQVPVLAPISASAGSLFWVFLKIGALIYGSGYVLFAFLEDELVTTGLLTRQQLLDAIAVGQFTPGPVFSSATFVGYQLAGTSGAIAATIGIFLPAFLFVALLNPLVARLRSSPLAAAFLDAVNAASVVLIAVISYTLFRESVFDAMTLLLFLLALLALWRFPNWNSAWWILVGAGVGFLMFKK